MQRKTDSCQIPHLFRQQGFLLMGVLVVLALAGIALMGAVDFWTVQRQREREQQLLFVGDAYRQAIRHYYFGAPPGTPRTLPTSLEALLEDERYPMAVHHLRRLYPDPITGKNEWGELRIGNFIAGVFSLSEAHPIKQANFPAGLASLSEKSSYKEWVFVFAEAPGLASVLGKNGPQESAAPAVFSSRPTQGSAK